MFIIYILAGLASGVLGAMGIGGGSVLILILSGFMEVGQKSSQFINLLAFVIPAVTAVIIHSKEGLINKKNVIFTVIGGLPTAVLGALAASMLDNGVLRHIFGIFLILLGVFEIFGKMLYNIIEGKFTNKKSSSKTEH